MMTKPIDIVGATNPGRYNKISAEATYNMIVSNGALVPYSGYRKARSIADSGKARAIFRSELGNFLLVVVDDGVYRVSTGLSSQKIGDLTTTSGSVEIDENGSSEIAISDGAQLYRYDYESDTFDTQIPFPGPPVIAPNSITQSLGYLFVTGLEKNFFGYSAVNDMTTFPNVNQNEIGSDKIVGVAQFREMVFVFGQRHTKIWRDMGLAEDPFRLDQSVVMEYGCLNKDSIAVGIDFVCWVAASEDTNASIMVSTGGNPQALSTDGIDFKLSQLSAPEDCSGFIFQEDGHVFYQVTFETDNLTLVYDFTSKGFIYVTDENLDHHIAKKVVNFNGKYYFISYDDANLYEMGSHLTTYNGAIIPRIRITKNHSSPTYSLIRCDKLEVVAEQGMEDGSMHIDMAISKDGGESFGHYTRKELSRKGDRKGVIRFWRLGTARDWTYQFRFYGEGRFVILGSHAEVSDADLKLAA